MLARTLSSQKCRCVISLLQASKASYIARFVLAPFVPGNKMDPAASSGWTMLTCRLITPNGFGTCFQSHTAYDEPAAHQVLQGFQRSCRSISMFNEPAGQQVLLE